MRTLALDIGKRRIGVAVSDPLGMVARPVETLHSISLNKDVAYLASLAKTLEAEQLVVGDPIHMSGDPSPMSGRARTFGNLLALATGLPVVYWDERLTTVEAQRILEDSGVQPRKVRLQIDAVAAAVILQSYLNTVKPPHAGIRPIGGQILVKYPIFDGHNDVLFNINYADLTDGRDFFKHNTTGHLDLPRALAGGFAGGFFAVYIPAEPEYRRPKGVSDTIHTEEGYQTPLAHEVGHAFARENALGLISTLYRLERESDGAFSVVRTAGEIEECIADGTIAAILHFEGAEPIDPGLESLPFYYEKGLRSLGIVWSRPNAFAHGVPFRYPHSPDTGPGLTPAGENLVRACNELRIMLDLSHLNEKGFWDVARLSTAPLVATHTAAHAITASTRNITDKQLDAIKESDGMVGLNFNVRDVRADGREELDTPLSHYVRQMDYLVDRLGIDHVGFGSDFDGAMISSEIGDVSGLPKLVAALEVHGYDELSLRKITHENWLRVLRKTWGE